jgi:hypothetical protein
MFSLISSAILFLRFFKISESKNTRLKIFDKCVNNSIFINDLIYYLKIEIKRSKTKLPKQ